jgi:hypothetical protein
MHNRSRPAVGMIQGRLYRETISLWTQAMSLRDPAIL